MNKLLLLLTLCLIALLPSLHSTGSSQESTDGDTKVLTPWYTGSLLPPTATTLYPGQLFIQPYLNFNNTLGKYRNNRNVEDKPNKLTIQSLTLVQFGIAPRFDFEVIPTFQWSRRQGSSSAGLGDTRALLGTQIVYQKMNSWQPDLRFAIGTIFPTGKYENLNPRKKGTDDRGNGAYGGFINLVTQKTFFWLPMHPIRIRIANEFTFFTSVDVQGLNSYGGGINTQGSIYPGKRYTGIFSVELSLSQNWVLAFDLQYRARAKTKFQGNKGLDENGKAAEVGSLASQQISLAPAVEYNFSEKIGLIAGAWFTAYGKNTNKFANGMVSLTYLLGNR